MRKKEIIWHGAGCIAFLIVPLLFFPRPPETSFFHFSGPTQRDLIANLLMLAFFYLNYYLLIPEFYFTKKYPLYISFIAAGFLIISFLPSLLTAGSIPGSGPPGRGGRQGHLPEPNNMTATSSYLQTVSHIIFLFLAVVLFSVLLRVRQRYFKTETARQQAELLSLKAQINPHFLFNTLNSIYSLALAGSPRAADAIVKLSGLMRYMMQDTKADFVALDKEVEYIRNYLDLQKARLGDTVAIVYSINGNAAGKQIAPLLLMSYIENAFKHGVNPDEESEIRMIIALDKNTLQLSVFNKKVSTVTGGEYGGIGLENTKERLQLLYPDRHALLISDTASGYTIELSLQL